MKCQKCDSNLKQIKVSVQGAKNKVISYQCQKCYYFEFEPISANKVIEELEEATDF